VTVTYFCPHCNSNQPIYEYMEHGLLKVRCQICGYPVEEGIVQKDTVVFNRPKILCIDDDRLLLGLFVNALASYDYRALTATDGLSGIETAKKERPDLILLDVMMPGLDGFEVCRRIRADPELKDTPVIILTALADPKLNVKGFRAGANLAVQKPFEPKRLIDTIKTALALKPKPPTI
jgi:DNA-binding response OmpR family regulator